MPLTTPGGALDPRDAWRGAEGAAIEEIKRQLTQVTDDLKRIRQEREQERLQEKQRAERDAALGALAPTAAVSCGQGRRTTAPPATSARAGAVYRSRRNWRHATRQTAAAPTSG